MKVVSFYTPRYEKFARLFRSSCERLGIRFDLLRETESDWKARTDYKPRFILDQLCRAGEPILWVDVDARFLRKPDLEPLEGYADAAVYRMPWTHKGYDRERPNPETLSGAVWLNDTPAARQLCRRWVEIMDDSPNLWDQHCLHLAIESLEGLRVADLGVEYLFVPGHTACADPVIEHLIASSDFLFEDAETYKGGRYAETYAKVKGQCQHPSQYMRALYAELFRGETYNVHRSDNRRYQWTLERLRRGGMPATLIDIGTGRGTFLKLLPENVTLQTVDLARFHDIERADFVPHDLRNPARPDFRRQFDALTCLDTLEHIPENAVAPALRWMATLSKRLYLTVANHEEIIQGEELHLTQRDHDWWLDLLWDTMVVQATETDHNGKACYFECVSQR